MHVCLYIYIYIYIYYMYRERQRERARERDIQRERASERERERERERARAREREGERERERKMSECGTPTSKQPCGSHEGGPLCCARSTTPRSMDSLPPGKALARLPPDSFRISLGYGVPSPVKDRVQKSLLLRCFRKQVVSDSHTLCWLQGCM